jgi:FkbM family methyltransferase
VTSTIGQAINDGLLRIGSGSRLRWPLTRARSVLIRAGDPLITYQIGDRSIQLPISHDLPHFQKVFPYYARNLGRITAILHQAHPDLAAVDVGANVGDSVAIIREHDEIPVLAIEGDRRFFALLERNAKALGPDLYLRCVMVGDSIGSGSGGMEARGGSAHYVEGIANNSPVRFERLSQIIGDAQQLAGRKLLIKIDTDGLDERIIKSEEAFLAARKPFLFFEYDPFHFERYNDDGFAVFASLRRAGYTRVLAYENTGELRESIAIEDEERLTRLHRFYSGRGGQAYVDLSAFHRDDEAAFATVLASERELFK